MQRRRPPVPLANRTARGGLTASALAALLAGAVLAGPRGIATEAVETAGGDADVELARAARALLAERCFACHGPDAAARERTGGLRLDTREGALAERDGVAAVRPWDPAESELLARVRARSPRAVMPPPASKLPPLSDEEVALLERWIAAGAPYAPHWSFAPRHAGGPPEVDDTAGWARDPLDRYVLARLRAEGLEPAPPADLATWARRVTLDLTGLPPAPADVERLLADAGTDEQAARAAFVDAALASRAYGEHQAVAWLDLARYADTHGYQSDRERAVWPWRDWLVDAWNDDLPYDAFVTRLVAGDMLPDATRDDRLATAFLRLHRQTNEGGSVEEEFRQEYVADRVETVGTSFLGLTLDCARCHDHKYDAVSQRDYYALAAYLDDVDESGLYSHFTDATPTPKLLLPDAAEEARLAQLEADVAAAEVALARAGTQARARFEAWCRAADASPAEARVDGIVARYGFDGGDATNALAPDEHCRPGPGVGLVDGERAGDGALLFQGDEEARVPRVATFARWEPFTLQVRLRVEELRERMVVLHRSRAWHDAGSQGYELLLEDGRPSAALIHFWPGDAVRVRARAPLAEGRWTTVTWTHDGSGRAAGMRLFVDGRPVEVEVVRDHLRQGIRGGGPGELSLGARFRDRGLAGGRITELLVAERALTPLEVGRVAARAAGRADDPLAAALLRRAPDDDALAAWWRAHHDADWRAAEATLQAARRARGELLDTLPSIMVMEERAEPRQAHVLERGRYDRPGAPVAPAVPEALATVAPETRQDRLGLARWLVDPAHPLTARVEVNRLWRAVFGTGLVATAEDWGVRGTPPSHPELLDHLAEAFVRDGWSRKRLLRRLVLSATYAQRSAGGPLALERDPEARLLSRYPRRRLAAEALRDQALAAAGLLRPYAGGRPVRPYQPDGLWREVSGLTYEPSSGDDLWRRSLYTFWKRTSPPPSMLLFDGAKRERCVARRQVTSTPLQALVLWNDPTFVEAARVLARNAWAAGDDDRARLEAAAARLALRLDAEEAELLLTLLDELEAARAGDPVGAQALLSVGAAPAWADAADAPGLARRAAWTLVASTLLSHPDVVEAR